MEFLSPELANTYSEYSNQSVHPHSLISFLVLSPEETLNPWLSIELPLETVIRLCGCAD